MTNNADAFYDRLHADKYRARGETFEGAMSRLSTALAPEGAERDALHEMLIQRRFLPAGRIQAAVGSPRKVTPFNCFVSGVIEDSFVDGPGSIMNRAAEAAATMRLGGGIGYDFSTLRPRGARIATLGSTSSGPVSFMEVFDAVGRCVASSGHRRGAQMGVLRVDHPDIIEFIEAKRNLGRLTGFNISVGITDAFMVAVERDADFELRFGGTTYRVVKARALWNKLLDSTWSWAEPGVLFIDRINEWNNLRGLETIAATNPCGEQPLPPHGACLLGSMNLVRYVKLDRRSGIDLDRLARDTRLAVRALDRVFDDAVYPLPAQKFEGQQKRRIGLGLTGVANALEAAGHGYGSASFLERLEDVLRVVRDEAYLASAELARERGAFPLYARSGFLDSLFGRTLPARVRDTIARNGLRNSHLLSIAPTGTISLCAGNVSSSIEPVFALEVRRKIKTSTGEEEVVLPDFGRRHLERSGRVASAVTAREHLAVLLLAQRYVDSAVSKTCNVPSTMPREEFRSIYMDAWRGGAKGCTTFTIGGERPGVIEAAPAADSSCRFDASTGERTCE